MGTSVLQLKNIYKSFTGNRVLSDIDLTVSAGEILCLVGGNGSGKSTLIKIISGFMHLTQVASYSTGMSILNLNLLNQSNKVYRLYIRISQCFPI